MSFEITSGLRIAQPVKRGGQRRLQNENGLIHALELLYNSGQAIMEFLVFRIDSAIGGCPEGITT